MAQPGAHSSKFWVEGLIAVCANPSCLDQFDTLRSKDEEERRASHPTEEKDDSMSEPTQDPKPERNPYQDIKHDLASFAGQLTRKVLTQTWRDGGSVYGFVRGIAGRLVWGTAMGAAGSVVGAASGFVMGPPGRKGPEDEREKLLRQVRVSQMARESMPMITSTLQNLEYDARKKLEEQGYYPCEECGVPHVKEEPHRMPPGTYWSEEQKRYVRPDDEEWSSEGYANCTGEKWEPEDEGGQENIH